MRNRVMMIRQLKLMGILLFQIFSISTFGQETDKDAAKIFILQAIQLENENKISMAIENIEKALKLDSQNIEYSYELAYAFYLNKEFNKAITILEPLLKHKDAFGKMYHLLGNSYDILSKRDKALMVYQSGIQLFPHTGELYLELGNIRFGLKDYPGAVKFYENGIRMDPMFPSNYFRAAKMFLSSSEKVWGMIYGELFLLLDPNSKRTGEITKLLFYTYKKQITLSNDSSWSVQFGSSLLPDINPRKDTLITFISFNKSLFEPVFTASVKNEKIINIASLNRLRKAFIETYFKTTVWQYYPNVLFDYQYRILIAGHTDAYNYWILAEGNPEEFKKWKAENNEKFGKFSDWIFRNQILLTDNYKFYREQY